MKTPSRRRRAPRTGFPNASAVAAPLCALEREFLALLASARDAGAHRESDAKLAKRYGWSTEDVAQPRVLRDKLLKEAADRLPPVDHGVDLRVLAKHFHLRAAADGLDAAVASEIVALLRDATRSSTNWVLPTFEGHRPDWEAAVFALVCLARRSQHRADTQDVRMNGVAASVRALRALGHQVSIRDGRVDFLGWEEQFLSQLDRDVQTIGGLVVAEAVFRGLATKLHRSQGYFHITRAASPLPMDVPRPGSPSGYLLNLAAKHLNAFAVREPIASSIDKVLMRADHYGRAHDLAPSNAWEVQNRDLRSILPFLRELAAYDTLYQVPQFRLRDAARAIAHLFDWAPPNVLQAEFAGTPDEVAGLMLRIDAQLQDEVGPATFTPADFSKVFSADQAQKMLEAFGHHDGCNVGFSGPFQTEHMDAWARPFFAGEGAFTILDARVAGNAFVECAAGLMRRVDSATDQQLGLSLERWVQAELRRKNVAVHSGKYKSSAGKGECDIVVQTQRKVILFELKRKSLTRRSRSADAWALLRDLQHAFLEPQRQLGGHEIALYRDGALELSDGTTVVRGDRDVERVALTLFDFGAFHTRDVSLQLLDLLAGAVVSSPQSAPDEVAKLNKLLKLLGEQSQELQSLKGVARPHFGCWFLGVPQLLVLLDNVDGEESLWTELKRVRRVSLGQLSWFSEYACMRSLPEIAKHADAVSQKNTIVIGG